ncbi:zinc finger protein 39 isoform X3 [Manduca sexta]|uniref:zinc finger protein 39 isoform X3 n=1 Tax=Manduca sexta TaxID=7130 RepID=UPI00188EF51B|nr:zinc finger protein 39 isoform X3 [Manduca sexta]
MSRQVDVKALVSHIVRGDGADKCRICMGDTAEGQVFLGDTVMMDGDKAVTLAELLELITGVEVESNSVLPNKLCKLCMAHITAFIPFLLLCRESSQRWEQITGILKDIKVPKKAKSYYVLVLKDIRTYSSTRTAENEKDALQNLKTKITNRKSYTKRIAKEGRMIKMRDAPKMTCPECKSIYTNIVKFNTHIKNVKKKMCVLCNVLIDLDTYEAHLNTHTDKVFACNMCPEAFLREKSLQIHKFKHKGDHVCVECKLSFMTSANLAAHLVIHQSQVCAGCGNKFNRICYTKHKQKCSFIEENRRFICDYCSKEYTRRSTLKLHIIHNHLTGKQFQCDQCGKTFLSRAHLVEHGNTHNKIVDRYVCSKCGNKFSTRRGHERHLKKHDSGTYGVRSKKKSKYVCPICKKVYYQKKSIDSHLRVKHDVVKISFE